VSSGEFIPLEQRVVAGLAEEGVYLPDYQAQLDQYLRRIEAKLDTLIKALAEDEPDQPTEGLGGERVPSLHQSSKGL
jgi:hypothetical protein